MLRDTPSSLPSEFSRLAEDGSPCGPAGPFHFGPFRGLARKGVHSLYQVILHHRGKEPSRDLGPRVPAAGVVSQPFSPRLAQGGMHPSVFPSFCPLCPSICPGMHAGTRGRGRAQTCQQNDPVLSLPGLNIHQAEDLWCRHWYKERWVLAHSNTVRVGEFSPLPLVLANCLSAACSLRTLKPPLQAQLLSPLLRAAVRQTVSGDWQQEPIHKLELSWAFLDILHALLANLLIQSPDTARLQLIMEHLSTWLDSPPAPGVSQGPWQHHGPAASRHHPPGV
ncbi:uncharacterized protein LOC112546746 isoform X5 [Pelodiscus sinensis]|uniref:uncharacterized protein LOC112546746 isoform X5 n=1 Tax=Pelodiscus sinensis TaxID=13735 RepID=UPI003F6A91E3